MNLVKKNKNLESGQSATEFALIAPLLFFIFFAIIQFSYMAFAAFALQRAAFSVAQESSLTGIRSGPRLYAKTAYALAPLASLHKAAFVSLFCTQCTCRVSEDQKQVIAQIRYPMPIWVPLAGKVFGEKITPAMNLNSTPEGQTLQGIFRLLGKKAPELSSDGDRLPYFRWMTFEAATYNEGLPR